MRKPSEGFCIDGTPPCGVAEMTRPVWPGGPSGANGERGRECERARGSVRERGSVSERTGARRTGRRHRVCTHPARRSRWSRFQPFAMRKPAHALRASVCFTQRVVRHSRVRHDTCSMNNVHMQGWLRGAGRACARYTAENQEQGGQLSFTSLDICRICTN